MNQDEFRRMLETPRASTSASATPRSRFGQAPPKRGAPVQKEEFKKPDLKPRSQKTAEWKGKKKAQQDEGAYRDRAAERRLGKDNDFSAAEKLLTDFQARSEGADIDKATLEEQMKYLGGDAEHSVLVKGLDFALLERQKYEQARVSDDKLADIEDELDRALSAKAKPKAAEPGGDQPRKRTRDEMLAELRGSRGAARGEGEGTPPIDKTLGKGFKPIGFKPFGNAAADGKKKKKKKIKVDEQPAGDAASVAVVAKAEEVASVKDEPPAEESDDDIFGGAGEWKPESDSDSDDDKKPQVASAPAPTASKPANYFDDDEEDIPADSTVPTAIANLANASAATNAPPSRPLGEDGEGEEDVRPMRLQGLTSSGMPSAKELLEMDKAAEAEEKRKEKKAKWKATAEEKKAAKERNMTEEERINRDLQLMQNYDRRKMKGGQESTWDIPDM